jgi:hypothetical protein
LVSSKQYPPSRREYSPRFSDGIDSVTILAKKLLIALVKKYAEADQGPGPSNVAATSSTPVASVFAMAVALQDKAATSKTTAGDEKEEVDLYSGNISPVSPDFNDSLGWWKVSFALVALNTVLKLIRGKQGHFEMHGACCAGYSCNPGCKHFRRASFFGCEAHSIGCSVFHEHGDGVRGYCYQGKAEVGACPRRRLHGFYQDSRQVNISRYIQNIFVFSLVNMNMIHYKYDTDPEH